MRRILFFIFFGIVLIVEAQNTFSYEEYNKHLLHLEFDKAGNYTRRLSDSKKSKILTQLATTLFYMGQEENSHTYRKKILESYNTKNKETEFYINLTNGYNQLYHNYSDGKSFDFFFRAYTIAKQKENKSYIITALQGILEFYHYQFSQTNTDFSKYLTEFKELAETPIEQCWSFTWQIYFDSQSLFASHRASTEALCLFENEISKLGKEHNLYPLFLSLKGVQLELIGEYKKAIDFHLEAYNLSKDKPFLEYIKFRSKIRLSNIAYKNKKFNKGLRHLKDAALYIDNSDTLRSIYYLKKYTAQNNSGLKNYKLAYDDYVESVRLRDLLEVKENTLESSRLERELQTAQKEKQILEEQALKKRNQNIAIGLGSSLVLLTIIGSLLYRNTKRKQRIAEQEKELQIQKTTTVLKEQEINTINAMVEGQEKERLRIARDLHDNLGGTLAAVKMHIGNLQLNLETSKNPKELLDKANELISEAYTNVRTIAHERNSGVIAKQGLLPAIQKLASTISSSGGLHIEVNDFGLEERLSNHLEITIFRIIQELVTNVIKHANASDLQISLTQHEKELNIVIEDNGNGFVVGKLQEKEGMGLGSIERRVEHLEGTMLVDSTLGKGTNIIIDIPL